MKREQVYQNFLKLLNELSRYHEEHRKACIAGVANLPNGQNPCEAGPPVELRYGYLSALNDVRIYGSAGTKAAAHEIRKILPDPFNGKEFVQGDVDFGRYTAAYNEFMNAMCLDVRPVPQQICE